MKPSLRLVAVATCTALSLASASYAHSPYGKALKEHYGLRSVTCYACHVRGKDPETGKPLGKEHLNEFGEVLHGVLKEKQITQQIEAAKKEGPKERKQVNELATEEFLKAFATVKTSASASERTWEELITSGEQEGIKLKSATGAQAEDDEESEEEEDE